MPYKVNNTVTVTRRHFELDKGASLSISPSLPTTQWRPAEARRPNDLKALLRRLALSQASEKDQQR